ncbi:hypothetical protein VTO42DRAFT_5233 [Malbranchea cinnamomea]
MVEIEVFPVACEDRESLSDRLCCETKMHTVESVVPETLRSALEHNTLASGMPARFRIYLECDIPAV